MKNVAIRGLGYEVEWAGIGPSEYARLANGSVSIDLIWDIQAGCHFASFISGPANNGAEIVYDGQILQKIHVPDRSLVPEPVEFETEYLLVQVRYQRGIWCEYGPVAIYDGKLVQMAGKRLQFGAGKCRFDFACARYGNAKVVAGHDFMGIHFGPDYEEPIESADVRTDSREFFVLDRSGLRTEVRIAE